MAVRRIISFSLALVCLFCLFCNSIYAIEFEPNCLNRQNEYEINSFIRTKETYINSSTYTKVTSAGNYGRSDVLWKNIMLNPLAFIIDRSIKMTKAQKIMALAFFFLGLSILSACINIKDDSLWLGASTFVLVPLGCVLFIKGLFTKWQVLKNLKIIQYAFKKSRIGGNYVGSCVAITRCVRTTAPAVAWSRGRREAPACVLFFAYLRWAGGSFPFAGGFPRPACIPPRRLL